MTEIVIVRVYTGLVKSEGDKDMFDFLFAFIDGTWTLAEAVERIKGNTRRYARKQLTWYKKDEQIRWFHPDEKDQIISYISQDYEQRNI